MYGYHYFQFPFQHQFIVNATANRPIASLTPWVSIVWTARRTQKGGIVRSAKLGSTTRGQERVVCPVLVVQQVSSKGEKRPIPTGI